MLRYLQWMAIAGVWWPLAFVAAWYGLVLHGSSPNSTSDAGWGLAFFGMLFVFAAAHALAISSLVGVGLLFIGQAPRYWATALSAGVGWLASVWFLGRIYFGVGA